MVTLYTIPRAFAGPFVTIQDNALNSWRRIPGAEILLYSNDEGVPEAAMRHEATALQAECNDRGVPLVGPVVLGATARACHKWRWFINTDCIVLAEQLPRVFSILRPLTEKYEAGVVIGQRRNLDVGPIAWDVGTIDNLVSRSTQWNNDAVDYFLYWGTPWEAIPPFAVGREFYDHWLVAEAIRRGNPVIDATAALTVLHQNHPIKPGVASPKAEFAENRAMFGNKRSGIEAATWRITTNGIVEKK